ncbi:MAG: hypothetical protein R6U70_10650 [Bacillota bacterium]
MPSIHCILLGFGAAARAFMRILSDHEPELERKYGVRVTITGAVTLNHGSFIMPRGLSAARLLREYDGSAGLWALPQFSGSTLDFIRDCPADVAFEMTPLNPQSGQPALDHVKTALRSGKHVISANKGPAACGLKEVRRISRETAKRFLYETAVMDGAPVLNLMDRCLPGCRVTEFRGVLNSTANFILDRLTEGSDFSAALAAAQEMGCAEADPTMDVQGWDSACKTAVLMNTWMDADVTPREIPRQGIVHVDRTMLADARERGMRLRLICRGAYEGGIPKGSVALVEVPLASEMAAVRGTTSLLRISTDLMGDISITEHEPGIEQTGYGLFSDLLRLLNDGMLTDAS